MLSICIPVYNYDIRALIHQLTAQIDQLTAQINPQTKKIEIIIIDDGSDEGYRKLNRSITNYTNVIYKEQINNGRAKTRNKLAEIANYNNLLFLDCDCEPNTQFIQNYINKLPYQGVIVGGLKYHDKPKDKSQVLRWKVGIKREQKTVKKRNKNTYGNFLSSNFVINKEIFNTHKFNLNLQGYGHEDTLLGIELKKNNIPILHLDNPVYHLGIDEIHTYLKKIKQSIKNLKIIKNIEEVESNIKILRVYTLTKKLYLNTIVCRILKTILPSLERYLLNCGTNLFAWDLYKLGLALIILNKK